jgi:hypothetical protein
VTENENSRVDDFPEGEGPQVWGAAMYAIEIGRRPHTNEPYAIIKGLMLEGFDPDQVGTRKPVGDEPVIETLLRRDEHTGLWETEQSRYMGEDGEYVYMDVTGMSMDPLEGVKMLLEDEA